MSASQAIRFPDDFKIVTLHMSCRTDRLPLIERASRLLGGEVEVVEAYTPNNAPPKLYPLMHNKKWAVTASKLKAFDIAVRSGKEYVLFMEDDCVFDDENNLVGRIQNILDTAIDFDIIYGGYSIFGDPKYNFRKLAHSEPIPVFRHNGSGKVVCNHCLFFRNTVLQQFIDCLSNPDEWDGIPCLHSDEMLW